MEKYSDEWNKKVIRDVREDTTIEHLMEKYDITKTEVEAIKKATIKKEDDIVDKIKEDIKNGMKYRDAEKKYNVPRSTIWSWIHG